MLSSVFLVLSLSFFKMPVNSPLSSTWFSDLCYSSCLFLDFCSAMILDSAFVDFWFA